MTDFRTRKKDGQVFPISSGKEFRQVDDYKPLEESLSEEKVLGEKMKKKYKPEKPSFSTRSGVKHDIKHMMQKEDSDEHGSKDYIHYKRKLGNYAEKRYKKENKKAKRRRKKELKKEQKQREKE